MGDGIIEYNSASCGRVTLNRLHDGVRCFAEGLNTIAKLEAHFAQQVSHGLRVAVQFYLIASDYDAIRDEMLGLTKFVAPVRTDRNGAPPRNER